MRARPVSILAMVCALVLCASQAAAASPSASSYFAGPEMLQADPDGLSLQPGEFAWLPAAAEASNSPVTMLVSLRDQRGYVYRDGRRIAVTTVSTGVPGHDTPTGVFPIMGKERIHHSNRYDNAPMPWMQRLTRWGHALHAGHVRAGTASHGCIRLPAEFARQLYSLTRPGDLVVISQDASVSALARAGVGSRIGSLLDAPMPPTAIDYVMRGGDFTPEVASDVGQVADTAF